MARGSLFAAVLALGLLLPGLPGAETVPEVREDDSPPPISAKDAERLFLGYINDPGSLVRNCMFLGGVRVEEITATKAPIM